MKWTWREAPATSAMRWPAASWIQAQVQLRRLLARRALWPKLLMAVGAAAGAVAQLRHGADWSEVLGNLPLFAVGVSALFYGGVALREDIEQGALELYYLRPRGPVAVPIGRWLAVVIVSAAIGEVAWLASTIGSVDLAATPDAADIARAALALLLASMAYSATFVALSSWFESATVVGLAWLGIGDFLLPKFSPLIRLLSPRHHAHCLMDGRYPPDRSLLDLLQMPDAIAPSTNRFDAWVVPIETGLLIGLTAVFLGVALVRFRRSVR